jgi:signal transduction histidine kinase
MEPKERKILVVDDNLQFTEMLSQLLKIDGYRTLTASSGKTALETVSSEHPDLVLLDLKLPDMSGEDVLKRIKEMNESVGVIVLTGYGGEQRAVDLMKTGALDFLSKPIKRETLARAVRDALQICDVQVEDKEKRSSQSLEKFFPFLAHEIRNPLHAIGGALAIIQRRSDLKDEFLAKSIKIIQEEIDHLSEFVRECLDFVRPPAQHRLVKFDINEALPVVINIIHHMLEELSQKIRITTETSSQLPRLNGNYEEIKQAFLNIVKNAFEAMGDGGELTIMTRFKSDPSPGSIETVFIDNGCGIKKDDMKRLFHPFFSTKRRGSGLGLAICQRIIVERHHGKIHVESEEGQGTKVTVELPLSQEYESDVQVPPQKSG